MQNLYDSAPEKHIVAKTAHLALPVRWSILGQQNRGPAEVGCTYDIHATGARLIGSSTVSLGDLVVVERGRNKAICQVTWAADPNSSMRGQFAVRCVEGKPPWEEELRQAEEQFQCFEVEELQRGPFGRHIGTPQNRRRRPRYHVEGHAEVIDRMHHAAGEVVQISEFGARISTTEQLRPGADFRLSMTLFDVNMALKARVRYLVNNFGIGVEFQEIRRGDRPILQYVLGKLKGRPLEDFVEVEVVADRVVWAAAGSVAG